MKPEYFGFNRNVFVSFEGRCDNVEIVVLSIGLSPHLKKIFRTFPSNIIIIILLNAFVCLFIDIHVFKTFL